jgi:hypothetical protein
MRRQDIGGEDLEARVARLDRLGDLLEHLQVEGAGQRDVEGVVDVGIALPSRRALLDDLLEVAARPQVGEVDVGRRAAAGHAHGVLLGAEGLGRCVRMRHDSVGQMRVGLDATRRHDLAQCVDDACRRGGQRAGKRHRRDALAFDADVPGADAVGGNDLSAANHEIEHDGLLFSVEGGLDGPLRASPGNGVAPASRRARVEGGLDGPLRASPRNGLRRQAGARTAATPTRSPE